VTGVLSSLNLLQIEMTAISTCTERQDFEPLLVEVKQDIALRESCDEIMEICFGGMFG